MDTVVVGGPTNSLVRHGKEGSRGFGGERELKVGKTEKGEEEWKVSYHLTDPVKINMVEKAELVERFADMAQKLKSIVGENVTVVHVTMFPRFVKKCCRAHMADEDVWLLDGVRRDVNKEIVDIMTEKGLGVLTVERWTLLGARDEMTLGELRKMNCVGNDNVHLRDITNRNAAETLCHRLLEMGRRGSRLEMSGKRTRLE
jgi:hypothetical protein